MYIQVTNTAARYIPQAERLGCFEPDNWQQWLATVLAFIG